MAPAFLAVILLGMPDILAFMECKQLRHEEELYGFGLLVEPGKVIVERTRGGNPFSVGMKDRPASGRGI